MIEGMDCLKLELVPKRELGKNDLSVLKAAGFKPDGKGAVWPQFRSWEPGWQPWFINQTEAEQLLADLPRLTAFYELFERYPKLYDERPMTEIPFLPARLPDRPLKPDDLDWQPLLLPPLAGFDPFQASTKHYEELRSLKQQPGREVEFECTMIPAASFHENGRPCLARVGLLVERPSGLVSGTELMSGTVKPGEAAGSMLMKSFLKARALPETIFIAGTRFQPVLQPLCDELNIKLCPVSSLPLLEEAVASLAGFMRGDGF
ncbi:MAG TPA: hypothetical protein VG347_05560 [Verrucomicrobiae bacterium]|nr:hypothetical protein [Verrucomicrobiae bacterium]